MEGQIFTPQGSEMLNEIVVLFWVSVIATLTALIVEWATNVIDD